ncbi:uncharacterized protein DEA37_0002486 [Paragonimus westermani]|uniref:Complex 1 LYR protein domain-containing protein n=1 Tax=Paragonimus westermani TaxID=34504 RepID=A0A5J4NEP6_9TREM|nr:uncharacterized protein DEA37_0002486 [Paragonimus westermani]
MTRYVVLNLYRSLLRYANSLQFSDANYVKYRIRQVFAANKELTDPKAVEFFINESPQHGTREQFEYHRGNADISVVVTWCPGAVFESVNNRPQSKITSSVSLLKRKGCSGDNFSPLSLQSTEEVSDLRIY